MTCKHKAGWRRWTGELIEIEPQVGSNLCVICSSFFEHWKKPKGISIWRGGKVYPAPGMEEWLTLNIDQRNEANR
jgi:hypothetical protein